MNVPTVTRQPAVPKPQQQQGRSTLLDTGSHPIHRNTVTRPDGTEGPFDFHRARVDGVVAVRGGGGRDDGRPAPALRAGVSVLMAANAIQAAGRA
ncbi:hypothetical protein ACFP3U_18550 [Kitasatospora misakiensis]|uniref:Uncharacterized protein n=1 Tax=Kitasatospora misakiensis TaxID=67330 RepID=A0ABW0X8W4_9ACTN